MGTTLWLLRLRQATLAWPNNHDPDYDFRFFTIRYVCWNGQVYHKICLLAISILSICAAGFTCKYVCCSCCLTCCCRKVTCSCNCCNEEVSCVDTSIVHQPTVAGISTSPMNGQTLPNAPNSMIVPSYENLVKPLPNAPLEVHKAHLAKKSAEKESCWTCKTDVGCCGMSYETRQNIHECAKCLQGW